MAIPRHGSPQPAVQVFVTECGPVHFYLYGTNDSDSLEGALSLGERATLTNKIQRHGGRVCDRVDEADDVIVIVKDEGVQRLRERYRLLRRHTEPPGFVKARIRNNRYAHEPVHQRPMGGRIPGAPRVEYTEEDDENICKYLATVTPDPEAGGRQGLGVYKQLLVSARENPEHAWANRHPVESWKERYKKNKKRLDKRISAIVEKHPPPANGQGRYQFSRVRNGSAPNQFARFNAQDNGDEEENELVREEEEEAFNEFAPRRDIPAARRRTDVGPRQQPSFEPPRGRSPISGGEFESYVGRYEEMELDDRPGPEDAGTQRTTFRPVPRPVVRPRARTPVIPLPASHAPMSSQATLVGPVPSQMQNAPGGEQLEKPRVPLKKPVRLDQVPQPPAVSVEPLPPSGARHTRNERRDGSGKGKRKAPAVAREEEQEQIEDIQYGQTNEEERDVEDLLGGTDAGHQSNVTALLESDDERTRQQLLPPPNKRPRIEDDEDDDIEYAERLDLTGLSRRSSGVVQAMRLPVTRFPVQRHLATPLFRQPSMSEESEVPLVGTRGSAEKHRAKESMRYEPLAGTRAAEVASVAATPQPR